MANWTGPDPNNLLPGEPWTSQLALAAFEDAVAIAEGAAGAPAVLARAQAEDILADFTTTASGFNITFTDLPPYAQYAVYFDNFKSAVASSAHRVLLSSDNGSTFPANLTVSEIADYRVNGLFGKVEITQSFGCTTILPVTSKMGGASGVLRGAINFTAQINAIRVDNFGGSIPIGPRVVITGMVRRIETL